MQTTTSVAASRSPTGETKPLMGGFLYKTIAICPNFSDVGVAMTLLNKEGFTNDQISLLGREQEHWQEELGHEWDALKTAKGTLEGAALGSIPGLVLVAGVALTGGAGLLVAGPMVAAMTALGMGALGGSVMGGVASNNLDDVQTMNVEEAVKDAISHGQWVIVAHSYNEAEAMHAQALLPNSRIVLENESNEP
jgi:hypothetical protein